MKKYGNFVLMPLGFHTWAIVIEYRDLKLDLEAGGINIFGAAVRIVRTLEKAFRTVKEYERRMGRV